MSQPNKELAALREAVDCPVMPAPPPPPTELHGAAEAAYCAGWLKGWRESQLRMRERNLAALGARDE